MVSKIELAKSNRSTCKICNQKIEKDTPRFGLESVFKRGEDEFTSYKWHHIECMLKNNPDAFINAEGLDLLTPEQESELAKLKEKSLSSGVSFFEVEDLTGEEGKVNVQAKVFRLLPAREVEFRGSFVDAKTLQIGNSARRVKFLLFDTNQEIKKGDTVYLKGVLSDLSEEGGVLLYSDPDTKVYLNEPPSEENKLQIYVSAELDNPPNTTCEFSVAKSSRAKCFVCKEPIQKGEPKLSKPSWIETPRGKIVGNVSYHLECALSDSDSEEMMKEAFSKLTPQFISENADMLQTIKEKLSKPTQTFISDYF